MITGKISTTLVKFVDKTRRNIQNRGNLTSFSEQPSDKFDTVSDPVQKKFCAHDLFSMFTADIIKDGRNFVR